MQKFIVYLKHYFLTAIVSALPLLSIANINSFPLVQWDKWFVRSTGFQYADAGYSTALPFGKRLWLFGDTIICGWPFFARNSIGLLTKFNSHSLTQKMDYHFQFYARDQFGKTLDITTGCRGQGIEWFTTPHENLANNNPTKTWEWPTGITYISGKIYLFYTQFHCTLGNIASGCHGPWNFADGQQDMGIVPNSHSSPLKWHLSIKPMKMLYTQQHERILWGSGLIHLGTSLYLTGRDKFGNLYLAQATVKTLSHNLAWQYFTTCGWQSGFKLPLSSCPLQTIAHQVPTEYSLHILETRHEASYLLIHGNPLIDNNIILRYSSDLTHWPDIKNQDLSGKISEINVDRIDPAGADRQHYIYAIKGQTDMVKLPQLIVTYFSTKTQKLRFLQLTVS